MTSSVYSFDTSALIDGLERFYPLDNFPGLWERVDGLITLGRIRISAEAWAEAVRSDMPVKEWLLERGSGREAAIYETDHHVSYIAGRIVQDFPSWSRKGGRNGADPFVIAVAEHLHGVVVTGEKDGGPGKPKIPYVCGQRGTPVSRFVDVIRAEGWRFG